jgi:hypothetical protein
LPSAKIEATIRASKRQQTRALDRAATGISNNNDDNDNNNNNNNNLTIIIY